MTPVRQDVGDRAALWGRLLAWSAIPVFLLLCVAAKLLSLGLLGARAAAAFEANDAASVRAAAEALEPANIIEPHKAPFAGGDAHVLAGDFGTARLRFGEALDLVPAGQAGSAEACVIRVNLVLAIERLGDERLGAAEPDPAAGLFEEALEAVAAAPEGCFSGGVPAEPGGRLAAAEARLQEKLAEAREAPPDAERAEPGPEEAPDSTQQGKLEQLEDSARQAQRERNSGRERDEYLGETEYAPGPEKPW